MVSTTRAPSMAASTSTAASSSRTSASASTETATATATATATSRTKLTADVAIADGVLSAAEARILVDTYATESRDVALWPLLDVHRAIARGAVQAEPAAHATLRNLLVQERASVGERLAKRTLAALGAAGEDGTIDVDDAKKILHVARRDANGAAADKAIGEAFTAFADGGMSTAITKIDPAAMTLFEAHFAARGLPYGENKARVEHDVLRCLRYLKGRDVSSPPDTRVLHELKLGIDSSFQAHTAFVDPEQRRTWVRVGEKTWYGPISLDRGPEGKTLSITSLLQREPRTWSSEGAPAEERTRWIVGGPQPELYAYAALVENEDATKATIERRNRANGRVDYCEVAF